MAEPRSRAAWAVAGTVVTLLVGVGWAAISITPAEFDVARWCFGISGTIVAGAIVIQLVETSWPVWMRVAVTAIAGAVMAVVVVESFRLISRREAAVALAASIVPSPTTHQELCRDVDTYVARLRDLERRYSLEEDAASTRYDETIRRAATEDERNRAWAQMSQEQQRIRSAKQHEALSLVGRGQHLRDALHAAIPTTERPTLQWSDGSEIYFSGSIAGPHPILDAANYLDRLARKLCP